MPNLQIASVNDSVCSQRKETGSEQSLEVLHSPHYKNMRSYCCRVTLISDLSVLYSDILLETGQIDPVYIQIIVYTTQYTNNHIHHPGPTLKNKSNMN